MLDLENLLARREFSRKTINSPDFLEKADIVQQFVEAINAERVELKGYWKYDHKKCKGVGKCKVLNCVCPHLLTSSLCIGCEKRKWVKYKPIEWIALYMKLRGKSKQQLYALLGECQKWKKEGKFGWAFFGSLKIRPVDKSPVQK